MKKVKNIFFYLAIIGTFSALIYSIISMGGKLEGGRGIISIVSEMDPFQEFLNSLKENLHHSIALLILQIVVIIIVARFFGWIFKKIGQPSVIGEILAGIVLGPSLLGLYFPEVSGFLFPSESLGKLQVLSQIGLILFMFIIGMELNLKALQSKAHDAIVISHASIIIPFSLGVGLAYFIYENHAPEHIEFTSFSLFMGISLSITAFPVLARIIQERGIHKTKLGAVVITCAAADDITAWCLLAAVIAIVKAGSVVSSLYTILFALMYVLFMIKVVRPFLKKIGQLYQSEKQVSQSVVAIFFVVLLLSAFITETIGIHALFGAFMAGAIMPDNINFRKIFIGKIEDIALVLLLPIFFVISGLRTEIGLINDPALWEITGLIILLAIIGKFVGSAIAAKFVGQNWKDSLTIGALMNTRGLMELVALNIGYELGVLKAEVFAMMVIMALVTTFMAGPILKLINKIFKEDEKNKASEMISDITKHKFLLFFRKPEKGVSLVKLADSLSKKVDENTSLTAVHMIPSTGLQQIDMDSYEKESFLPIVTKANSLNRNIISLFKISKDVNTDLIDIANKGEYDLMMMNIEESIFEGSFLGRALGFTAQIINPEKLINTVTGKEKLIESSFIDNGTRLILSKTKVPVGILIDKNLDTLNNIFIPILSENDEFLINYAQKFIHNVGSQVSVLDISNKNNPNVKERIRLIEHNAPNHIRSVSLEYINEGFLKKQDLIIVSLENFEKFVMSKKDWINNINSMFILTK